MTEPEHWPLDDELEDEGVPEASTPSEPPPKWTRPDLIDRAYFDIITSINGTDSDIRRRELSEELDQLREVEQDTAPYWQEKADALARQEQEIEARVEPAPAIPEPDLPKRQRDQFLLKRKGD
jgi:hypothetical protein